MKTELWLPTKAAAKALGVSPDTLKRRRESVGGFLENGRHYSLGPCRNSPITWSVERCREAFNYRGIRAVQLAVPLQNLENRGHALMKLGQLNRHGTDCNQRLSPPA